MYRIYIGVVFMICFINNVSWGQNQLRITNPSEFEFVHCYPVSSENAARVAHYVFDLRNENQHKLYSEVASNQLKAVELGDLGLIDENILTNTLPDFDVSWISEKLNLVFKLIILDTDGTLLEGELVNQGQISSVRCREVVSE